MLVDDQAVTYKWLAYDQAISMKDARLALDKFVKSRSDNTKQRTLVTYILTGREAGSKAAHNVKIVSEDKLESVKSKMNVVLSQHIYAVQPAVDSDQSAILTNITTSKISQLLNSDGAASQNLIENRFGAVSFSGRGGIGQRRIVAAPQRGKVFTKPAGESTNTAAAAFKRMGSKGTKKPVSTRNYFQKKTPAPAPESAQAKLFAKVKKPDEDGDKKDDTKNKETTVQGKESVTSSSSSVNVGKEKGDESPKKDAEETPAKKVVDDKESEREPEEKSTKKPRKVLEDSDDDLDFEAADSDGGPKADKVVAKAALAVGDTMDVDDDVKDHGNTEKPAAEEKNVAANLDQEEDEEDEATRIAREREEIAKQEAEEKEKEKEKRREASRLARQERKRQAEEDAKAKSRERLGVQVGSSSQGSSGATRKVKRRRIVKENVVDDEGFLVVRERVIEEEVDEPIPELVKPKLESNNNKTTNAKSSVAPTSTANKSKKSGGKAKQLTLSSMFKKKA